MRLAAAIVLLATLALVGCSSQRKLTATSRAPSTDAFLGIDSDRNGNGLLTVKVAHLPPPSRIAPGLTTYVVWISTPDYGATMNAGMLKVDEAQTGWMQTTTPYREFLVRITAEKSGEATYPSEHVVAEGAAKR
jgi:uncharacterized protein YceK